MSSLEFESLNDRPVRKPHTLASIARQTNKRRIVVVEADIDKAVYEAILDKALGMANFIIYSPLDLGAKVDGKTGVSAVHAEMLATTPQDQEGLEKVYFILDKDVDDILGRLHSSPRVIHTTGYNIESDLFEACDLGRAIAACLLKPLSVIAPLNLNSTTRRQSINARWKEWVIACIFVRMHLCDGAPKAYSIKSQIHNGDGTLNASKLSAWKKLLQEKSGKEAAEVNQIWDQLERAVHRWFITDRGHKLVNGKWYPALIAIELRALGFLTKSECSDLRSIWGMIISSLTNDCQLVKTYRNKLGVG